MNGQRRTLFVSGTLEVGGSETKIVKLANALAALGRDVGVAYLNGPDTLLRRLDDSVPVTYLDRRGKYSVKSLSKLRSLVRQRYDNLVSVNFYPMLYTLPAIALLRQSTLRSVGLINTTDFPKEQWMYGPVYAPFVRRCDTVVFGCEHQRAMWSSKYRIPLERSVTLYNGVDADYFEPTGDTGLREEFLASFGVPPAVRTIGSVGRLAPEKNYRALIEVLHRLVDLEHDVHLFLVGDGREKGDLQQIATELGVGERVHFVGKLNDVRPALAAFDVFVLPSSSVETFSNAALEAMSMQRPVILSNVGGAAEMIDDQQTGYIFEPQDPDRLLKILEDLLVSNDIRTKIGAAARDAVVERFGFARMVSEYDRLLSSDSARSA